ncbi:hypothetical protein XH96_08180 [Bradyrhizobium sp. CCBAU 51765]|nr:hypothetical protein XH96_08180 [Bradyrhizobium sp. CCBAU 51765]
MCEQPIPNEKAEQVRSRMEARERELADAVGARLKEQFAVERVKIEANARAMVEQAKKESAVALEAVRNEAAAKELAARQEGEKVGQAAAQQQINALRQANTELQASTRQQIETLTQANVDVRAAAQQQVALAERGKTEVEAAARERIAAAETAKITAENEAKALKHNQETVLKERLQEQREVLEKDKAAALNAKDAKHLDENQKLKDKLDEALRKLEQKTAEELGEGAEVDLFEELKYLFEGDRIRRVPKGAPGADIIHEVIENGKVCGKIVYDSKKRNAWRSEYATKLCEDKIAEGADHAILSLLKFPAEERQLAVRDGVVLANPARVAVIAEILRDDIVRSHGLRLSGQEREKKKGELYAYITGERFRQHMTSIEAQTDKLLDVDVAEEKAHRKVWETRGGLLKSLQKAHGNLRADVARNAE